MQTKPSKSKEETAAWIETPNACYLVGETQIDKQAREDAETLRALQFALNPLQLCDTPPESERQILRCAPPFDAQAEHEADLRYESRVDYESWLTDQPEDEMGGE